MARRRIRTRIAVDLDGTLLNTLAGWMKAFERRYGKVPRISWTDYEFCREINMTRDDMMMIFGEIDPDDIELMDENAFDVVTGLDCDFVTDKGEKAMEWTRQVLAREGLDDIRIVRARTDRKHLLRDYGVFVDDNPMVIANVTRMNGAEAVAFCAPPYAYNTHVKCRWRAADWLEVETAVTDILGRIHGGRRRKKRIPRW